MPYRDFDTATWTDPWFEKLTSMQKLLFIYCWTNDHCTQSGLYYLSTKKIAFETGLPEKQVKELLPVLSPKILYDSSACLLWVRNFVRKQRKSDTFLVAVSRSLEKIKPHAFLREFSKEYQGFKIAYLQTIDKLSIVDKSVLICTEKKGESEGKEKLINKNGAFEKFWEMYPARNGKKLLKKDAQEYFKKNIKDEEISLILQAVHNYANSTGCRDGYSKDAIRWLRKDHWREWLEPEKTDEKKGRAPRCVFDNLKACYRDCKGCKSFET